MKSKRFQRILLWLILLLSVCSVHLATDPEAAVLARNMEITVQDTAQETTTQTAAQSTASEATAQTAAQTGSPESDAQSGTLIVTVQHAGQELILYNTQTGRQWRRAADEEGRAIYTDLPEGIYRVEMADDGSSEVVMQSFQLEIPYNHTEYVIHATPKWAEGQEESSDTMEEDPLLPQTGSLWWPVPLLIIAGGFCLRIGCVINKETGYENDES